MQLLVVRGMELRSVRARGSMPCPCLCTDVCLKRHELPCEDHASMISHATIALASFQFCNRRILYTT